MNVNERIKARRKELDLDADTLADLLGISRATYYRYESKEIEKIPISALVPLAKALRVTPAYLMGWEEPAPLTLTAQEETHIQKYRQLDADGKEDVDDYVDMKLAKLQRNAEKDEENLG